MPPTTTTTTTTTTAPAMPARQDSLATVDMHIPGAWVGTNPSTPAPISEDIKYFGEQLKTLPSTVQNYIPKNEDGTPVTATLKDKAASLLPAGALNTAAAYLPASLNPTVAPTAADAPPPVTNEARHVEQPLLPTTNADMPASNKQVDEAEIKDEQPKPKTWTQTAASVVPAGVAAYLPSALNPNAPTVETPTEGAPTPFGEHEGLNAPLPPVPSESSTSAPPAPVVGSTVSPDEDVQAALSNSPNPEQYKTEVPVANPPGTSSEEKSVIESTRAVGGETPITPLSDPEGGGYPAKGEHGVSGITEATARGAIGAFATDHALKDQKEAAIRGHETPRPTEATKPQDSFAHVVIPATPGAGLNEQEMFNKNTAKDGTLSPEKKHKKSRSGSTSAGEASPSSPSKSMFGGIRKLTKKRDRSRSKGAHSRDVSADETGVLAGATTSKHRDDTLESQHSGSSGGGNSPVTDRKGHNVLHKDPPTGHQHPNTHINESANLATTDPSLDNNANNTAAELGMQEATPVPTNNPATITYNSGSVKEKNGTPNMLSNPFSPGSPSSSSPHKVGLKDKIKGEFMVVQGVLSRDEGLKEAGEKMKKGTL